MGAAGTTAAGIGLDKLAAVGVPYHGLEILGDGAILSGLVLAAIGVFIIEREFDKAAAFAGVGAILTFFGFMHGPAVGIAVTPARGRSPTPSLRPSCSRLAVSPALGMVPTAQAHASGRTGGIRRQQPQIIVACVSRNQGQSPLNLHAFMRVWR